MSTEYWDPQRSSELALPSGDTAAPRQGDLPALPDGEGSASGEEAGGGVEPEVGPAAPRQVPGVLVGLSGLLVIGVLYAWRIGQPGPTLESVEMAAVEIGRAALLQGELAPVSMGVPAPDHPLLHAQILRGLFSLVGVSGSAARGVSAAFALLAVLALGISCARRAGALAGVVSAGALACAVGWLAGARVAEPGAVAASLCGLAWLGPMMARDGTPRLGGTLLWLAGSLAWLAGAGPMGLALPWCAYALHLLVHLRVRALVDWGNHRGVLLAVLLLASVFGALLWEQAQMLERWAGDTRHWAQAWVGGRPQLHPERFGPLLGLLPGAIFLPAALAPAFLGRRRGGHYALWTLGLGLALLLLSPRPSPVLALALFPPAAWLVGVEVASRFSVGASRRVPELWALVLASVVGIAGLFIPTDLLASGLPAIPERFYALRDHFDLFQRVVAGGAWTLCTVLVVVTLSGGRHGWALGMVATLGPGLAIAANYWTAPVVHRARSHMPFLERISFEGGEEARWIWIGQPRAGVAVALGDRVRWVDDELGLAAGLEGLEEPVYVVGGLESEFEGLTPRGNETVHEFQPLGLGWPEEGERLGWWIAQPGSVESPGDSTGLLPGPAEGATPAAEAGGGGLKLDIDTTFGALPLRSNETLEEIELVEAPGDENLGTAAGDSVDRD